jgi:hypothetical protein
VTGRGNPEPDLPPRVVPCDELVLQVVLIDVDVEVAATVAANQTLRVALIDDRYPAVFAGDRRVGSVASGGALSPLVQCLRGGQSYGAVVLEVDGAFVTVRIAST